MTKPSMWKLTVFFVSSVALVGCGQSQGDGVLAQWIGKSTLPAATVILPELKLTPTVTTPGRKFAVTFTSPGNSPNGTLLIRGAGEGNSTDDVSGWKIPRVIESRSILIPNEGELVTQEFTAPSQAGCYELLIELNGASRGIHFLVED